MAGALQSMTDNMKIKIILPILILTTTSCLLATLSFPFQSWDWVKSHSNDIVIARCSKTPIPAPIRHDMLVDADGEVISVLKGKIKPGPTIFRVWMHHWPCQNEYYLIFGFHDNNLFEATDSYRVVPLGFSFSTNFLAGKTLDEQIQLLLQRRLDALNRQMAIEQEEKRILEQGVKR